MYVRIMYTVDRVCIVDSVHCLEDWVCHQQLLVVMDL